MHFLELQAVHVQSKHYIRRDIGHIEGKYIQYSFEILTRRKLPMAAQGFVIC